MSTTFTTKAVADSSQGTSGTVTLTAQPTVVNKGEWGAIRFAGLTIPRNAVISSVVLKLYVNATKTDSPNATVWAQAADNASALTANANDISSRARTTATASWVGTDLSASGAVTVSVTVTNPVKEVLARAGWRPGNALVVVMQQAAGAAEGTSWYNVEGGGTTVPQLVVTYTTAPGMSTLDGQGGGGTARETFSNDFSGALPTLDEGILSRDAGDPSSYARSIASGALRFTNDGSTGTGGNLRAVQVPAGAPDVADGEVHSIWTAQNSPSHNAQEGHVHRAVIDPDTGLATAVTITKNVVFGATYILNVHVMSGAADLTNPDDGSTGNTFVQFGSVNLQAYLGSDATFPWHVKTRVRGRQVQVKVWKVGDPEPAYGDPTRGTSVRIPDTAPAWALQPGRHGLYVGHLANGETMTYDDLSVSTLGVASGTAVIRARRIPVGMAQPLWYSYEGTRGGATGFEARLDEYEALGVEWVRFDANWNGSITGSYWAEWDDAVQRVHARGMKVLGCFAEPPSGASAPDPTSFITDWLTNHERPDAIEVMNEVNLGTSFWSMSWGPVGYATFLVQTFEAVKAITLDIPVVTAGFANYGDGRNPWGFPNETDPSPSQPASYTDLVDDRQMDPVSYMRKVVDSTAIQDFYAQHGRYPWDALGHHPYANWSDLVIGGQPKAALTNLIALHNFAVSLGDPGLVWQTEYNVADSRWGYSSGHDDTVIQAWLTDFLEWWFAQDWTGPTFIFTLDVPPTEGTLTKSYSILDVTASTPPLGARHPQFDTLASLSRAVSLTSAGSLSATGAQVVGASGAAEFDGVGSFSATGSVIVPGAVSFDGLGALDAGGHARVAGATSLDALGTLAPGGHARVSGVVSFDGSGVLTVSAGGRISGAATFDGTGALAAGGHALVAGATSLDALGALDAGGHARVAGAVSFDGVGSMTVGSVAQFVGAVVLSGLGGLDFAGTTVVHGQTVLAGSGILSGRVNGVWAGFVTFSGSGSLSGDGTTVALAGALLAGSGGLSVDGTTRGLGAVSLTGSGALDADGLVVGRSTALLDGTGSLAADGLIRAVAQAILDGHGSFVLATAGVAFGTVVLSGSGGLDADGVVVGRSAALLAGSGALSGDGTTVAVAAVVFDGHGALYLGAVVSIQGAALLDGSGVLDAGGHARVRGDVDLDGLGALTAVGLQVDGTEPVYLVEPPFEVRLLAPFERDAIIVS